MSCSLWPLGKRCSKRGGSQDVRGYWSNDFFLVACQQATLLEQLGGQDGLAAAVDIFYMKVMGDETLAPFFAGMDMAMQRKKQVWIYHRRERYHCLICAYMRWIRYLFALACTVSGVQLFRTGRILAGQPVELIR